MTMRSPIVAMLWENWRLTRVEAAQRLSFGIVGGSAVLALSDAGATYAFWILLSQHAMFFMAIAKLNGGRFLDGYKPGFPLHLLYTRPVPTIVLVGVAMAYDAVSSAAMYLVCAALLGFAFGQRLPLIAVAVWIVAFHLISTAVQWSTRSRVVQYLGSFGICLPFFLLLYRAGRSPLQIEFSLAETALMASIGLVSFGLTVAGVARQRRGDTLTSRTAGSAAYPDWLVTLFRLPCPTTSATSAQVWFELKSSGLPVLMIGLAVAVLNPLLFAVSIPVPWLRPFAVCCAMLSGPAVLILGGNAFGIRRKQGRTYASAFDATQPYSTAGLASLKLLVRSVCVLAALVAMGASVWASSSLMSEWDYAAGEAVLNAPAGLMAPQIDAQVAAKLLRARREIGGAMTGYPLAASAVVTSIGIAVMVALLAARAAVRARFPRGLIVAGSLLLLYGLALVLLAFARRRGVGLEVLADAVFDGTPRIAAAAIVLATVYLFWRLFAEQVLTLRAACGAVLVSAAFGVAWVTILRAAGVQLVTMPTTDAVWMLSPAFLPLMASVVAPWSLSRVRHT